MAIEAIIFDLDNTLIHRKQVFAAYTEYFVKQFIVAEGLEKREAVIERIRLADQEGYRDKRELYTELHADLELKNPDTTVQEMLGFWCGEFHKFTVLMDGGQGSAVRRVCIQYDISIRFSILASAILRGNLTNFQQPKQIFSSVRTGDLA